MDRREALVRIAWHNVKQLTRNEAESIIRRFFKEPLKPSLRRKLNITAVAQWESHTPPDNLHPGNPIYRPILIDRIRQKYLGATNTYLADYLRTHLNFEVDTVSGPIPELLPCPVCGYKTFVELGTWLTCPVCGWNSDPMQEAMPTEAVGGNGISLIDARRNFAELGAVSEDKLTHIDPDGRQKYPRTEGGDS